MGLDAKTIYVSPNGNSANNGTTWENAVKDLQRAHELAVKGDEIWMAGGTYFLDDLAPLTTTVCYVEMKDGVDIYGGFSIGDGSVAARVRPDAANAPYQFANPTILTLRAATTATRIFDRPGADKVPNSGWKNIMDGLQMEDVNTTNGRLFYINVGATFRNSIIRRSSAGTSILYFEQNGLCENNLFEGNKPNASGAGTLVQAQHIWGGLPGTAIRNNKFVNNDLNATSVYNAKTAASPTVTENTPSYVENNHYTGNTRGKVIMINDQFFAPTYVNNNVIENCTGASIGLTNYDASLIHANATAKTYITNNRIFNNANTNLPVSAEGPTGYWRNSLIHVGGMIHFVNNLVVNNSSNVASVTISNGFIGNSTIMNNTGRMIVEHAAAIFNTVMKNQGHGSDKALRFESNTNNAWTSNNLVSSIENDYSYNEDFEFDFVVESPFEGNSANFVNPTSFMGIATTEGERAELASANYSLVEGSNCSGNGENDALYEFVGEIKDTYFAKDLSGANRTTAGKISIGAYEGTVATSAGKVEAAKFARVFANGGKLIVESQVAASAKVYTIAGVEVANAIITEGENSIAVASGQVYIVMLNSAAGRAAYKVIL